MIVSKNLLSHFFKEIDKYSLDEIVNTFLRSGIEVEDMEIIKAPTGIFYGIVKQANFMPEAKNPLKYCHVWIPLTNEWLKIVCGGINVIEGMKVVVAKAGAKILNHELTIIDRSILEYESQGMICAFGELWKSNILNVLIDKNKEIIALDADWDCNQEFKSEHLNLDDVVFKLTLPTNRPALNCAWSLAMELQSYIGISDEMVKTTRNIQIDPNYFMNIKNFDGWYMKSLLLNNNIRSIRSNINDYFLLAYQSESSCYDNFFAGYRGFLCSLLWDNIDKTNGKPTCVDPFIEKPESFKVDWLKIQQIFNQDKEFPERARSVLKKRHFNFQDDSQVIPPPWRDDLFDHGTFMNEISTLLDLNEISEISKEIKLNSLEDKNHEYYYLKKIKDFLIAQGFLYIETGSMVSWKSANQQLFDYSNAYRCCNSFIKSGGVWNKNDQTPDTLRKDALHNLIHVMKTNHQHKGELFPVFEISKISEIDNHEWVLNIVMPPEITPFGMNETKLSHDVYDLMSIIKKTQHFIGEVWEYEESKESLYYFQPGQTLKILKNQEMIGYIGNVLLWSDKQNKDTSSAATVIKLSIKQRIKQMTIASQSIPKHPVSIKDISIQLPKIKTISIEGIIDLIKSSVFCIDCKIIEKYEEKHSCLFRITFQSSNKTLTKEDINSELKDIYSLLQKHNIVIR